MATADRLAKQLASHAISATLFTCAKTIPTLKPSKSRERRVMRATRILVMLESCACRNAMLTSWSITGTATQWLLNASNP